MYSPEAHPRSKEEFEQRLFEIQVEIKKVSSDALSASRRDLEEILYKLEDVLSRWFENK